jgi:hypothetical protein
LNPLTPAFRCAGLRPALGRPVPKWVLRPSNCVIRHSAVRGGSCPPPPFFPSPAKLRAPGIRRLAAGPPPKRPTEPRSGEGARGCGGQCPRAIYYFNSSPPASGGAVGAIYSSHTSYNVLCLIYFLLRYKVGLSKALEVGWAKAKRCPPGSPVCMAKPDGIALYVLGITRDFSTAVPRGVAPGRTDP